MTMNFSTILKSNWNFLNIKFGSLQEGFLKCVLRMNENKENIKNNLKIPQEKPFDLVFLPQT